MSKVENQFTTTSNCLRKPPFTHLFSSNNGINSIPLKCTWSKEKGNWKFVLCPSWPKKKGKATWLTHYDGNCSVWYHVEEIWKKRKANKSKRPIQTLTWSMQEAENTSKTYSQDQEKLKEIPSLPLKSFLNNFFFRNIWNTITFIHTAFKPLAGS